MPQRFFLRDFKMRFRLKTKTQAIPNPIDWGERCIGQTRKTRSRWLSTDNAGVDINPGFGIIHQGAFNIRRNPRYRLKNGEKP